jgi:UDP-GlcNAc:undecaprenyl-phosphate GlcNAc-1-phosphate transferase
MQVWSFVLLLTLSATLTYGVRKLALKFNVRPKSDYRRQQRGSRIALWGGLSLYFTIVAGYLLDPSQVLMNIIICAAPLIVVGLIDDRQELSAKTKFLNQITVACLWLYMSRYDGNLLIGSGFPYYIAWPLSALWIIGLCNAFNLIDGTDGQCSTAALVGFVVISASFSNLTFASVPLIAATLGFLFWNRPPAKIYLGESGSTLLGFSMAALTLSIPAQGKALSLILGALFLAAFPLTDTLLAIARRKLKGRPLFSGDKDHIHHNLQKIGLNKTQVMLVVGFIVAAGGLSSFILFKTTDVFASILITINSTALMCFILWGVFYVTKLAAHKVSYFGKTLLESHIENMNQDAIFSGARKGYVIDLLPYYTELQSSGLPHIMEFLSEVSKHFKDRQLYSLYSIGSYSIAVLYRHGDAWTELERQELNNSLKSIFTKFGVLKSLSDTPEGLFYYDHSNVEYLLTMIINQKLHLAESSKRSSLKVAS